MQSSFFLQGGFRIGATPQVYLAKAFIGMVKELTNLVVGACRNTQPTAKFIWLLAVEFNPR